MKVKLWIQAPSGLYFAFPENADFPAHKLGSADPADRPYKLLSSLAGGVASKCKPITSPGKTVPATGPLTGAVFSFVLEAAKSDTEMNPLFPISVAQSAFRFLFRQIFPKTGNSLETENQKSSFPTPVNQPPNLHMFTHILGVKYNTHPQKQPERKCVDG